MKIKKNPIIPGFYPDPSIVRVGEDFYLVTSSFSFFPGIPIFHSKNLFDWTQIGHVLDRIEQLHVTPKMLSAGIFAPTIRYHDGIFYVLSTNMSIGVKNFIVTATDPRGPWSDIHVIDGADGIDPSLFFDDDGKVYYTGTTRFEDEAGYRQGIWCSEINLQTMVLVGERHIIGMGAQVNAHAPEGPHIYKRHGFYYLMIAEGGTEHFHAITISRSPHIFGEYVNYEGNPIVTHRHLGKDYPICNIGHGDLCELNDGKFIMVLLGSRLVNGYHKLLGRETFIANVDWGDDWPVVNPGQGIIEIVREEDEKLVCQTDDFSSEQLNLEWNLIGTPYHAFYTLGQNQLRMKLMKEDIVPWELEGLSSNPFERLQKNHMKREFISFVGRRQQHISFQAITKLDFKPTNKEKAGMMILQNDYNQMRIEVSLHHNDDKSSQGIQVACYATIISTKDDKININNQCTGRQFLTHCQDSGIRLKVIGLHHLYQFFVEYNNQWLPIGDSIDGSFLGSETSGGFIGAYIGLYGANGEDNTKEVLFHEFTYQAIEGS